MKSKRNILAIRRRSLAVIPAALTIALLSAVPASASGFSTFLTTFSDRAIGTKSPVVTMHFEKLKWNYDTDATNDWRYSATIEDGLDSAGSTGNFKVVSNTCDPVGDPPMTSTCEVGVVFGPDTLGIKYAIVRMTSFEPNDGTAQVTGRGIMPTLPLGTPPIVQPSMTPKSHYFGSTIVGTLGNSQEFVFKAGNGPGNPSVQDIALFPNSAHYNIISDNCTGKTLGAGQTCNLVVRFKPTALGLKSTSLLVASGQGQVSSSLAGTGIVRPFGW